MSASFASPEELREVRAAAAAEGGRRIRTGGDGQAALGLIPITGPIYARDRELVARDHPHRAV